MLATEIGTTYRTKCGRGRTTYRPDWGDVIRPWIVYVDGTARVHAHSLQDASDALWRLARMTLRTK